MVFIGCTCMTYIYIYIYITKCDASAQNKYHNVNSVALILCFFLST